MAGTALRFRKGYVDAPTGQLHYRSYGEGEPLLLLHQSPQSSLQFLKAYPLFAAAGVRAIGLDTPGFGMSDVPERPPEIADYAAVIPYLLDGLGIARGAVLGHHTGSCVAAEFATRHPERVSKLILAGPGLLTHEERERWRKVVHPPPPPAEDGSHLLQQWRGRLEHTPGWTDLDAMHRAFVQKLVAGETEWYGHRAAFNYDLFPAFQTLRLPTLILTNTGDDIYPQAQRAQDLRPDLDYVELPGGTHDIVDEQPAAWTNAVIAFLRK